MDTVCIDFISGAFEAIYHAEGQTFRKTGVTAAELRAWAKRQHFDKITMTAEAEAAERTLTRGN